MAQQAKVPATKLSKFDPWDPHGGRRESAPKGCPLTSTHEPVVRYFDRILTIKFESEGLS